jgi:hypothetical protein
MKKQKSYAVNDFDGCQLNCIPNFSVGIADHPDQFSFAAIKRLLAYPWNYFVKKNLKKLYYKFINPGKQATRQETLKVFSPAVAFTKGDLVRVRTKDEIQSTLDRFNELKGCAFLAEMHQYCGTEQRVFKVMERFLDERDYKVKKTRGLVLLENNFCSGTPAFGKCDRSCFLFWREEWLEKIEN